MKKSINLQKLREMKEVFQLELSNRFQMLSTSETNIESNYQDMARTIVKMAHKIAGTQMKSATDKISEETRKMLAERLNMKQHIIDKAQHIELCKNIRTRM